MVAVPQPEIAVDRALPRRVPREVQIAKRAEPIVETDVDQRTGVDEALTLFAEVARRPCAVSTTVDEYHHG